MRFIAVQLTMPAVFEFPHLVRPDEIDLLGHANNLAYLGWMQSAALAHSAAQGWAVEAYQQLGSGWVVRSHQIEYLRPALPGDEIVVRTWVAATRRATSLRKYQVLRRDQGTLLATAATQWAFVNFSSGMPTRIPPQVAEAFIVVDDETLAG